MACSPKSRNTQRNFRKKTLTKEMLLPLPAAKARAISLENHLALVTMRHGHGNPDVVSYLLKTVYLTCFLHEALHGRSELGPFREAERALMRSVKRAKIKAGWSMSDPDGAILETILALHDQQLAAVAVHQLSAARERLNRFIVSEQISPIPDDTAT
jgi:hypothetical protein